MQDQAGAWGPHPLPYVAHTLAVQTGHLPSRSCKRAFRLACGSFIPDEPNFVDLFTVDLDKQETVKRGARLPHYYPPTRMRWFEHFPGASAPREFLVTSGDCLRIWSVDGSAHGSSEGDLEMLLRHQQNPQNQCTPITSVDVSVNYQLSVHLASCDVYGICMLWDMVKGAEQAFDLGEPLWDVAFGPDRLVAAVGQSGTCFLIDPRQPKEVNRVLAPRKSVKGPARIAWGAQRPGFFAVAWQDEPGGLAFYSGSKMMQAPQMPQPQGPAGASIADLQWSQAFPDLLCCAKEDGVVDVWQFPEDGLDAAAAAASPSFSWEPAGRNELCTALALSHEFPTTSGVPSGQHALVLATMPQGQPGSVNQQAEPPCGSLWIANMPKQSGRRPAPPAPHEDPLWTFRDSPEARARAAASEAGAGGPGGGEQRPGQAAP